MECFRIYSTGSSATFQDLKMENRVLKILFDEEIKLDFIQKTKFDSL
jgi:hypothetical protein